jgi:hypothetical protein
MTAYRPDGAPEFRRPVCAAHLAHKIFGVHFHEVLSGDEQRETGKSR